MEQIHSGSGQRNSKHTQHEINREVLRGGDGIRDTDSGRYFKNELLRGESELMQSEAVRKLVTAANQARVILRVGGYKRSTSKCAATRLDHALAAVEAEEEVSFAEAMRRKVVAGGFEEPAVKAEEKPQTHEFIGSGVIQDYCIHADSASEFCGQSVFTPIHQTGGK